LIERRKLRRLDVLKTKSSTLKNLAQISQRTMKGYEKRTEKPHGRSLQEKNGGVQEGEKRGKKEEGKGRLNVPSMWRKC